MMNGFCRTANGGKGVYVELLNQSYNECRQRCNELSKCAAFEYNSIYKRCETHNEGTTTSTGNIGDVNCYIRAQGKTWD